MCEERISPDEYALVGDVPVTTPARTALDLARHLPRDLAVAHLDSLAGATAVTAAEALEIPTDIEEPVVSDARGRRWR